MERLTNRPLNSNGKAFYNGAYTQPTSKARFDGIAGFDNRDYGAASEKNVNHQFRMRPVEDEISEAYQVKMPSDQLYGFLRFDLMFSINFGTVSEISDIGTKEFCLQGLNRYLHEAKLEEEMAIEKKKRFKHKKFDVKFVQKYVHFLGILITDKDKPMIWGGTEKVATHATVGPNRMPSCFDVAELPPITRLGFIVKEVCIKESQTYVTNINQSGGITLKPPKDGLVTRVIPIAHPYRYLLNHCRVCGEPTEEDEPGDIQFPLRVVPTSCQHKNNTLEYEVHVTRDKHPEAYCKSLWTLYCARQRKNKEEIKPLFRTITKAERKAKKDLDEDFNVKTNYKEALPLIMREMNGTLIPDTLISRRKAHYIPFGMTEQGLMKTAFSPNVYRPNSEIDKTNYVLNEHIELWLRAE